MSRHSGDSAVGCGEVTLDRLPDGWAAEAAKIATTWRPYTPQNQPGSTISSPSP